MKKQVKVYIEGMELLTAHLVTKEIRKHFKELDVEHEVFGRSFLSEIYAELAKETPLYDIEIRYSETIRDFMDSKNYLDNYLFFLIPENFEIWNEQAKLPNDYKAIHSFFKQINQSTVFYGLDVKLVEVSEEDNVYSIRDKILKYIN
jgi:hypothetical protein